MHKKKKNNNNNNNNNNEIKYPGPKLTPSTESFKG